MLDFVAPMEKQNYNVEIADEESFEPAVLFAKIITRAFCLLKQCPESHDIINAIKT